MADNFPTKFGMEPDLRKCEGKTIERVELLAMEFGCTWRSAFAVRFSDGSRAFFSASPGTGIMNPQLDGQSYSYKTVETSDIFTKREYAEMLSARERDAEYRKRRHEQDERRRYEELAKKFGPQEARG